MNIMQEVEKAQTTRLLRANQQVEIERQRYRDLFEFAPDGYVVTDALGVIEEGNYSLARMLNVTQQFLRGKPIAVFVALGERRVFRTNLAHVGQHRDELIWNTMLQPRRRAAFPAQIHTAPVLRDDKPEQLRWLIRDITQQRVLEDALEEEKRQLQKLSQRLVEAQEAERRHLSRELHDEIGQMLTALKFSLEAGKHDVSDSKIDNALNITTDLMNQVRGLSLQLRPPMLDTLGLVAALRWQFERYTEQTGITVHFKCNHPPRRYAPSVELTAFRVTQEALNNIARYAQVSEAFVILNVGEAALHLSIEDKGVGFDYEKTKKAMTGSGLLGMQERVALVGGQFSIDAQPGQGTKISAEIYI